MRVDGLHDLVIVVTYALYLLVKLAQTGHISAQGRVDTHHAKLFGEDSFDDKPAAVVFQSGLCKHPTEADILLLIEPERVLVTDFSLFVLFFHLLRFKGARLGSGTRPRRARCTLLPSDDGKCVETTQGTTNGSNPSARGAFRAAILQRFSLDNKSFSIHDKGCKLIVTVDNGISAVEEADFAASLGMDLIITDHHLPPETLPKAVAVVDPRREDDHSPFKGLCGAGVAFKLCAALDGCPPEEMLDYCGDLAAVGTVADVMPLVGENRTLVKAGLRQLQQTDRPGFGALLEEVGLAGKPITAENISYAIAPRINAAGRMDNAVTALQLVLCEDPDRAEELAHKLNEINAHRQETEQQIFKAAEELLEQQPERLDDRIMLLWGRDWHPGVIGIVASRLVERTGRPVIVVTIDEHGEGKGSGRSVQGFNLHTCIGSCADLLVRYGGHAMAAGLSVREENLPELRRRLNEWAARECPVLHTPPLTCDVTIHLDRITVESVRHLDQLAPYGAENPTPVFLLQSAVVDGVYPGIGGTAQPPAAAAGQ